MTLAIKDSPEVAGAPKPGSPAQNSENTSGHSPRSNPVCLEVPVTVRSLPRENGNAPGAAGPIREEGRSVIVFDNGGVLRLANPLPVGQTVILSNPQGRDVVCRVVGGRNLPSIKGYIEVEFIEPVSDFWHIHQPLEPAHVLPPEAPAPLPLQASPVEEPPAPPVPSRPAVSAKELNAPSSGAPTFEDIAGLVLMSPPGGPREKKNEASARPSSLLGKDGSAHSPADTPKLNSSNRPVSSVSELVPEKAAVPPPQTAFSAPARKESLSNDSTRNGAQASVPISFASPSSGESRGRMPLLLGGAALVLVGFGAGYFFMHRGTAPGPASPAAIASQPSAPPADASSGPGTAPASQPVVEQAAPQTVPPVSTVATVPAGVVGPAPAESQDARQHASTVDAKQLDRAAARRQPIPNLKLSSPTKPGQNLANLPDGSSLAAADIVSTVAPGAASPAALVVRAENQPAPPASLSTPPSAKTVQDAKLISSTRPIYPAMAKEAKTQGHVVITAMIDEKGSVTAAKAVSGPMSLRQAAVDAVKQWKYSPAQIDGKPAASQITIGLDFRLN